MKSETSSNDGAPTIEQARESYTDGKAFDSESTRRVYLTGINHFIKWCEQEDLTHTSDLSKMNVQPFRNHVMDMDIKTYSKSTYIWGVRDFLDYLDDTLGVLPDTEVYRALEGVKVPPREKRRDESIEQERLDSILAHMMDYYPRHRDTIIMRILSATGMRTCELYAVDVGDVTVTGEGPVIQVRCRKGTPLKRGRNYRSHKNHERDVPIDEQLLKDIREYVEAHRHDVTDGCSGALCGSDDHGCAGTCERSDRLPLITSRNGRLSKGQIKAAVTKWTCPAHTGVGECIHDEKPSATAAGKCDPSITPHILRKQAITRFRNNGAGLDDIGEMVGADPEQLKEHYDFGDNEERSGRARNVLEAVEESEEEPAD